MIYKTIAAFAFMALLLAFAEEAQATNVGGFQAESMTLTPGAGQVYSEGKGKALLIWSNGIASKHKWIKGESNQLRIKARGDQCDGAPAMTVRVDGKQVLRTLVSNDTWKNFYVPVNLQRGVHKVDIEFSNDYRTWTCDRNLRLDVVQFQMVNAEPAPEPVPEPIPSPEPAPEPAPAPETDNPFSGERLYVNPYNASASSGINKIANQPTAAWFGEWSGDVRAAVDNYVTASGDALPVLVAYNIPIRDCGSYSSGGAPSAEAYRHWIDAFAAGIGGRKAVVILEPDATALQHCLTQLQTDERNALLRYAVAELTAKGAAVYIDAGHSNWHSADEMASRLSKAGVADARGFALNVSNFEYTSNVVAYGNDISSRIGKPFVVDTSRNGNGPGDTWCNPSGRALGEPPTVNTGTKADAYLWVKPPGESDGTCNGGPPAGQWWQEYAQGLAQRASY